MIEKMKVVNTIGTAAASNQQNSTQANNDQNIHKAEIASNNGHCYNNQAVDDTDKIKDEQSVSKPISDSQICTISSSDVDGQQSSNENDRSDNQQQAISTIELNPNESETNNSLDEDKKDHDDEDKSSNQDNVPKDDLDVAATRSFRKNSSNKTSKDFYSNLLLSGQQQVKLNNNINPQQQEKFRGIASTTPAFRIPEFTWSSLHLKLLNDLLYCIECDIQMWKSQGSTKDLGKEFDETAAKVISATHLDQILQNPGNVLIKNSNVSILIFKFIFFNI